MKVHAMNDWATWIANALPLVLILGLWFVIMRKLKGSGTKDCVDLMRKQNEMLEQQLAVLRETNELLKKLSEPRG